MELWKDIIPSILKTKQSLEDESDFKKVYVPFVVNMALSYHVDCLEIVNYINCYPNVDKLLHYHYLLNSIRPMNRRYQKWEKKVKDSALEAIKEYFSCSIGKAKEISKLLSADQKKEIIKKMDKGGIVK